MLKLNELVPVNLLAEKEKFFANDTDYNPQFKYQTTIKQSDLSFYGEARWHHCRLAKKIIKQAQKEKLFQKNQLVKEKLESATVSEIINNYLANYSLDKKYQVIFDENLTSRFAVNFKDNVIKVRLPISFSEQKLSNTLDHEIGTHVLRQENYEKQIWYRRKKHYGFSNYLRTEEGLAVIHQYLNSDQQLIFKTALSYLGAQVAQKKDFKTVYAFFYQYVQDSQKSWFYALKNKRGLTDTSLPGGLNKSLVYLEGFEQVLKYLRSHQYNPSPLYYGKLAIQDLQKAQEMNPNYQPLLPKFYLDNPLAYRDKVKAIAKRNFIF
jgi:hypothetical protein